MIYLAYDGSMNGDWVARYAIRMAAHRDPAQLHLLHVVDDSIGAHELEEKIEQLESECKKQKVKLSHELLLPREGVAQTLATAIPSEEDTLVCGLRQRGRNKGYLAGTISEALLELNKFNVMAFRVVHAGRLGVPRNVLLPISHTWHNFHHGFPFLQFFADDLENVHYLHVVKVNSLRFQYMSHKKSVELRARGLTFINEVIDQLPAITAKLDKQVILSDDTVKEILIQASKFKVDMICMGAGDRSLASRFFYGNPIEQILRQTACDIAIYRGL